jgi:hypothetical protein
MLTKQLSLKQKEEALTAEAIRRDEAAVQHAYPQYYDAPGTHAEGVLDFGELPVPTNYEKDSHDMGGILSP